MRVLLEEIEIGFRSIIREEITLALDSVENSNVSVDEPFRKLLTSKGAALYCPISEVTLWRMRNNCEIGFFRVGNRVLYSIEKHLMQFFRKSRTQFLNSKNEM